MRVTFLGTGSALPSGQRVQTGLLVESGERRLLVDCGSGVLHALARTQVGYEGVDTVLLTHHHLDHVADLLPFVKARWLGGTQSVTIAGPPGTSDRLDALFDVYAYLQDRIDVTVREVDAGTFPVAGFDVDAIETRHSMPCLAYRITPSDAGSFVFSGDTAPSTRLLSVADGASVLAHDCSFPDDVETDNHPTPTTLGQALAEVDPAIDQLYLTHLYPQTDGRHEEMLATIRQYYDGDVAIARDGLTVEV